MNYDVPKVSWPLPISLGLLILLMPLNLIHCVNSFTKGSLYLPVLSELHINNSYGLFRVMTRERPEIILQGSRDGRTWKDYGFTYKPGDFDRMPPIVAPHQPRLDWQMWFAALGTIDYNPWLVALMVGILQDRPEVTHLIQHNPFPDAPPIYMRAVRTQYRFTTWKEGWETGGWWKQEPTLESYCRPIQLRQ